MSLSVQGWRKLCWRPCRGACDLVERTFKYAWMQAGLSLDNPGQQPGQLGRVGHPCLEAGTVLPTSASPACSCHLELPSHFAVNRRHCVHINTQERARTHCCPASAVILRGWRAEEGPRGDQTAQRRQARAQHRQEVQDVHADSWQAPSLHPTLVASFQCCSVLLLATHFAAIS